MSGAARTLARALIDALRGHGVREVFGIPGDFALPLFDAFEREADLPLYTLSHEPSAGFAADAAARIRGTPSVLALTYGAGALNAVNAVAAAYAEKSPVVVISGAPGAAERSGPLLLHHQAKTLDSQYAIFREITCDQARLDDPERAEGMIRRALDNAVRYSRPVYLEVPRDILDAPCPASLAEAFASPDPDAVAACAEEILERLTLAMRPVLMVGVEVRRFGLEARVARLARTLGIPVVTSFMGRGLLAGADAPLAGTYLGVAGDPAVTQLVEESDGLLLLGVIVSDTNFGLSHRRVDLRRTVQALDRRVTLGHHTYFEIPLPDLVEALLARARALATAHPVQPSAVPRGMPLDATPIAPDDIAAGLNDVIARVGPFPIAADVGDCMFIAMDLEPSDYVAPGYYASMGFGVPAALGVQAATGRRPLAIVGDGAFQMTGWELGHCRRYGWDPIVVVVNNQGWGMLSAFRPGASYTALGDWDFAACANALGGRGRRVHTRAELAAALDEAAKERGRFQLIDVQVAPGARSRTLQRFAGGIAPPRAPPPR